MPRIQTRDHGTSVSYRPWQNILNDQQILADFYSTDAGFRPAGGAKNLAFAFPIDGVGDLKPPFPTLLIVTSDNVPDSIGGNPTITVGAPSTISTIDTIGDQDFFQITLEAGKSYQIGMYGYAGGPNGAPLADSYIELYNSDGQFVVSADGGADTPANQLNSGFDALLTFNAEVSGTYYINARSFDNTPLDGISTGDGLGDYELFAQEIDPNDPSVYHPYYDVDSPLYAIDWGTRVNKVNQSAANPDGDEGTRDTGNAQGTPVFGSANDIPALALAQGVDITGKNVITVYFARAGDVFVSNDPTNPGLPPVLITAVGVQPYEREAVVTALGEFSKVADVVYLEVDDRDKADFVYTSYQGTPGPGVSLLGSMSPPDESDEGLAQFNSGDERWNELNLQQGGFSFTTLIHEFGHGHGLAHPHDNGGHSGIMNGVEAEGLGVADYTTGDYHLNQGVFTMMSYEDGWQDSPYDNADTDVGYGYLGSLMAFDIAAIQDKYGVNEDYATGNETYVLKDVNAAGTYFSSIWDGGGIDAITYTGTRNTTIDLRPATLLYEEGGGGRVSYAYGIFGGFTIANGVTIENAASGSGNDTLIGNAVDNVLNGGAGADSIDGGAGNDTASYQGAIGSVFASLASGQGFGNSAQGDTLIRIENLVGTAFADYFIGEGGVNRLDGAGGDDTLIGGLGADVLIGGLGNDTASYEDNWGDVFVNLATGQGFNNAAQGDSYSGIENLTGGAFRDFFIGDNGANILNGADGNDTLIGGLGADQLVGGTGTDTASYEDNQGAVFINLTIGQGFGNAAQGDTFSSIENVVGGAFADYFIGDGNANFLDAKAGADTMTGAGGADIFAFTTALANGVDTITDFVSGSDKIALDDAVFIAIGGLGALNANAFFAGTAAHDADDRVIYDAATGNLYYDADGNGAGAQVLFANLQSHPVIAATDFQVI